MKKLTLLLFSLLLVILGSCRTSDEALINPDEESLGRTWSLNKMSGGLAGISVIYPFGQITWSFDEATHILTIENNITTNGEEDIYSGQASGTYPYYLEVENGNSVLYIDNHKRGVITLTNNTFELNEGVEVDGMLLEFEEINP